MNLRSFITVIIVSLIFGSCQFNQSVNKDLSTGAYTRGDGISCNDVIIKVNEEVKNTNTFTYGEEITFVFNNVRGLTIEDGKSYPTLSMVVMKNEKDTVLNRPNLLNNLNQGTTLSPLRLTAYFVVALPNENGESYKMHITIKDQRGDGVLTYELPFTVENNDLLKVNSTSIDYSRIYLWNESTKKTVINGQVNSNDTLILIIEGVEGLEMKDNLIFPILSIEMSDRNGNKIISDPNILSNIERSGVNPKDFKDGQIPVILTFRSGTKNNPYQLIAVLKDKNSDNKIEILTELNLK
ncbi:MAG: hypothetical protein COA33_005390 [Fluviicola sp.]|nr:hypothetical protein [Fluviicola sp.]